MTAPSPVRSAWSPFAAGLALAAAALVAYASSFGGAFAFDDFTTIQDNPTIRRLWPIWQALSPPAGQGLTTNGRPLVNLSLAVNYAAGGLSVGGYHAFNLSVHVLAGLTLFGLVRRTLIRADVPRGAAAASTPLAFAIALLWIVHPLTTESVTYIVQRAESMMGLCYLLTLYGFMRYAEGEIPGGKTHAGKPAGRRGWAVLAVVACASGMAAKEVMVTAPLLAFLYDRTFVSGSAREAWRRHRGLYGGLAATWLLLAYEISITGNRAGTAGFGSAVSVGSYALAQFPALAHYLRLCFWPHPLVFDYGVGLPLTMAGAVPAVVFVTGLLGATVYGLFFSTRPAGRALGFAGGWFFLILAPTSSVVPIATQTLAEHRMYLPLAGVVATVVLTVFGGLTARRPAPRDTTRGLLLAALALAAVLGWTTARRNRDYRTNLSLWTATLDSYPSNMRAFYNRGCALLDAGRFADAIADFEIVLRHQPDYLEARGNLATADLKLGRSDEARIQYESALAAGLRSASAQFNLANLLAADRRYPEAAEHYRAALAIDPTHAKAHCNLGSTLVQIGELPAAATEYREALRLNPDLTEARDNLARVDAYLQAHP
jgi:Flp pilus assembly protein TadD